MAPGKIALRASLVAFWPGRLQPTPSQCAGKDAGKQLGVEKMPSVSMGEGGGYFRLRGPMPAIWRLMTQSGHRV
jgi:hypothetical protein